MRFWKDNRIDGEHEVAPTQAAAEFWADSAGGPAWESQGGRFERHLNGWLSITYGSWDPREQADEYEAVASAAWEARPL